MAYGPAASGSIPKSASACGTFGCENFGTRDHQQLYDSRVPSEPEVHGRTRGTICTNFGFAALVFQRDVIDLDQFFPTRELVRDHLGHLVWIPHFEIEA